MGSLTGKTVVLGISGGIAAYKIPLLVTMLRRAGADIHVIMTENAAQIIGPIVFDNLTGHKCLMETFDRAHEFKVEHVAIAKKADLFMIAPATANTIAKIANGLADNMLTTTFLASRCPKILVPSMNPAMLENPATVENLERCRRYGMRIMEPATGGLANGDEGKGKMPEPAELFEEIEYVLAREKDLTGKRILVTAGATQEALDPVRYLTNHSTGKMGFALAKAAAGRGADVTLISGQTDSSLHTPKGVHRIEIRSALDMFEAVQAYADGQDLIIKAAAVADYRPAVQAEEKIKKGSSALPEWNGKPVLPLERTDDILAWLGAHKRPGQLLCGFSMETEHLLENSRAKLEKKKLDMIVANNVKTEGAGFGTDTNVVTIITSDTEVKLPLMSKEAVADKILDEALRRMKA